MIVVLCGFTYKEYASAHSRPEFYVLTGGVSVGKTAIILALENKLGERVVREAATDIILFHQARNIKKPWEFFDDFQDQILRLCMMREKWASQLSNTKRVFLDRSWIDNIAFYEQEGRPLSQLTKEALKKLKQDKLYKKVFIIVNFGVFEANDIRRENLKQSQDQERRQEENYKKLGFEVIRIPPGTLEERVALIMKHVNA